MSHPALPAPATPLLGRSRELQETMRLLENTRLLTITGAGGSGKTRIALELAHRAAPQFEDGAIWTDLASLGEAELITQAILHAIGVREVATSDVMQVVIETLRDRALLLVLDNCEHLVDASAAVAEAVLRGCPGVTIITTTRETLGISGEQTWLVPPLSDSEAAQLFAERARAVSPSFDANAHREAIAHVCGRLDGIPLAIELAAARVKVLSVEQIAERLDDAFSVLSSGSRTLPRHRTIRETIDWSFRLLSHDEQLLLMRLAVFAESFSLPAAEAICTGRVLELLSALVDKSLVLFAGGRYRLLETVRQFAAAKLDESGQRDTLREKHARYFVELVEEMEPRLFAGAVDPSAMQVVDDEIGNIRAAFEWFEEDRGRVELELRLIWALHWYWFARGHFHEARRRVDTALVHAPDADAHVRARAIVAAGNSSVWQAQWTMIRPSIDEAIDVLRRSNDLRPLANALMLLGVAHAFGGGDAAEAKRLFDEAAEVARRDGRSVALALTLYWAGLAAHLRGDLQAARAALEEAYQIGVDTNTKPAIGHSMTVLGHIAVREEHFDEAVRCFTIALDVHSETDDRWGLTQVLEGVAFVLLERGRTEPGIRLLAGASAAWLNLGARSWDDSDRIRRALADPRLRVAIASGAAMPYDELVALAKSEIHRPATAPVATEGASLRISALGTLKIVRDGDLLETGQTGARARELLLFLLCNPGGSTKEHIGAALWPDVDPTKLRNNFHVTLHRLRKTLGNVVSVEGETYSIDRNAVDFDADTFEREVTNALRAVDQNADRLAAALELYRGDFLANVKAGEWIDAVRERLRELYASGLAALGRVRMSSGDFAAAAEIYEKLVMIDDLDEQAVRNLMRCLAKTGNTAAVSRAYRRLTSSLKRELGTEPDPATASLHARIVAGSE